MKTTLNIGGTFLRKIFITEFLLAFLLGAVPMIVGRYSNPDFSAVVTLSRLNPGDLVVSYFLYLSCFHLIVCAINRWGYKNNGPKSVYFDQLLQFTQKLGFAIHGIYRVLAGAVPAAILILFLDRGLVSGWQAVTFLSLVFTIGCLTASVALSQVSDYTAPRRNVFGDSTLDF